VLSNGHAGFGGRSGETHQRKRRQGAPGRPNIAEGKTHKEALRYLAGYNGQLVVTDGQVIVGAMLSQHPAGRTLQSPPAVGGAGGWLAAGLGAAGQAAVAGRAGLPTVLRWRRAWA
jgi:hypothetical protein